ncbi:hypothetical protein IMG5_084900 [Ichthyophthirius multifiliis]|uniref:Transmembrane protein n=1 Tax=Ichthyophthirius multifiliis TaxID=5932 RepID=G0QQW1_ICHMU|nr:hypothetical protein IMG5_084900 [Ichthyophthirius multifiliis]EGR32391.1 hypothetical protein IMG5_084900 [Ichthyophthirius multifiliis]|eukprot:XP_004035877.1 hypothetical protein IMG5_084900 [Ichthyophthirius multifiliis]
MINLKKVYFLKMDFLYKQKLRKQHLYSYLDYFINFLQKKVFYHYFYFRILLQYPFKCNNFQNSIFFLNFPQFLFLYFKSLFFQYFFSSQQNLIKAKLLFFRFLSFPLFFINYIKTQSFFLLKYQYFHQYFLLYHIFQVLFFLYFLLILTHNLLINHKKYINYFPGLKKNPLSILNIPNYYKRSNFMSKYCIKNTKKCLKNIPISIFRISNYLNILHNNLIKDILCKNHPINKIFSHIMHKQIYFKCNQCNFRLYMVYIILIFGLKHNLIDKNHTYFNYLNIQSIFQHCIFHKESYFHLKKSLLDIKGIISINLLKYTDFIGSQSDFHLQPINQQYHFFINLSIQFLNKKYILNNQGLYRDKKNIYFKLKQHLKHYIQNINVYLKENKIIINHIKYII